MNLPHSPEPANPKRGNPHRQPSDVPCPAQPAHTPHRRRRFPWRWSLPGLLHLGAILAIVFVVWGLAHDRLSPKSWSVPSEYVGDAAQMLTWIQAASEGHFVPFCSRTNPRLGAPYQANWDDYPMYEVVLISFLGLVARWFGLITAGAFGMVLSHLTSAISFYLCCRLLRFRREWAAAGSLLWSFTYYHTFRALGHLMLSYDYTVPLAMVCCWWLTAGRRIAPRGRFFWLCLGSGLVIGMGNPYNLNMWLQLLCWGMALRFLLFRRKADLAVGALVLAATTIGFLLANLNTFWYQALHGGNQLALVREYKQLELYALKPVELLLPPPTHRITYLADVSRRYAMAAWVHGEMFSPYLGVVAAASLMWMAGEFGLRLLNLRQLPRRLSLHAPQCLWVLLYATLGGGNCLLGLFGITYFRGSNRYSIFLSAIGLLFLVSRMSAITRRWSKLASYGLALGLAGLGLLDQLPPQPGTSAQQTAVSMVNNDRAFGQKLEAILPHGAMIFQLPVMNFIDANPIGECMPYEPVRPYLWTKTLRFSFGSIQGRTREDWQTQLALLPLEQSVPQLERYGFSALYINRKAFKDHNEATLRELAKLGKTRLIEDDAREQVCVLLDPSPNPTMPHSDDAAQVLYKSGWAFVEICPEGSWHWAHGDAAVCFINDRKERCDFRVTCLTGSLSPRRLDIQFEGQTLWTQELAAKQFLPVDFRVSAQPGRNYLYFKTDRPPVVPADRQVVRFAQGVLNLQFLKDPPSRP